MADQALWKGLFEWSMQHQDANSAPRPMAEEDKRWLEEALKSVMVDLGKRMVDIKDSLDSAEAGGSGGNSSEEPQVSASLEERERLLDELMDLVDQIDLARDLHTIGGLQTLLELLRSPHPSLRWRAAEVAATCVQNNPPVQKAFMDGGIMPRLLCLLDDEHATVQTKGLMAISCMVRGYPPALLLLRQQGGLARLVALLATPEPRLQRKCLQVLQYMLRVVPLDRRPAAVDTGLLPALSSAMGSDGNDVREAALAVAQQLAADDASLRVLQQCSEFRASLEALQMRLDTLPQEDWAAVEDEVAAAKALAEALQRQLPAEQPGSGAEGGSGQQPLPASVVDDSSTTGVPAAALQLALVPPSEPAPQAQQ